MHQTRVPDQRGSHEAPRNRRIHREPPPKLPEMASCPGCRASYREGRWTWEAAPVGCYEHVCPACERIAKDYPAGVLEVAGAFARAHREELIHLVRNVEKRESAEHPLKRIMLVEDDERGFSVSVTDEKLARSCGRALEQAYEGDLLEPPSTSDVENLVRVRWTRD
jgi:hypothetical protein